MTGESAELRVNVLGPLRAWNAESELRLGPTRQQVMFAVLALHPGQVVSRDELITAVWGYEAPTTAKGSIYTYVSGLRRALEPHRAARGTSAVLTSERTGYLLRIDSTTLDMTEFEALRVRAEEAFAAGAAAKAIELVDRALRLWNGEPLTGLPGPFVASMRERLDATRLSLLETRAMAGLRDGRHAELVAELTALVAQHPLREPLRGLLMTSLYRCGRQADALDQFQQARQVAREELGARPSSELVEIHRQILVHDPALGQPERTQATSQPRRFALPRSRARLFVGRHTERERLRAAVAGLSEGKGHAVWIEGEPGIGKSELLTAGLADLEAMPMELCWASGDELAQRFPLRLMLECLSVDPESPDPLRAEVAELVMRGSVNRGLLSGAGDPELAAVNGLVSLVHQLCAQRPVALVLDDLQWADDTSILVWNRLLPAIVRLPLLLVSACRPVPTSVALDHLRQAVTKHDGTMLRLGRLDGAEVDELLRGILDAMPGPELYRMARQAAGNPLYVQELVDALMREDVVRIVRGIAESNTPESDNIPVSLVSALTHRLRFLTADTIDILRGATLLGNEFSIDDLAVILDRHASELLPAVEEATIAGVLVDEGHRISFRHVLIRQVLYNEMSQVAKVALHRQTAERLDRAGRPIDTVARQLAAAPLAADRWTIEWVVNHGEHMAEWAPDIGLDLINSMISGCDSADPRVEKLTASKARIMYWLGDLPEDEARSVLTTTMDPALSGEMLWILGCVYYRSGFAQRAVNSLRETVQDPNVSTTWRARCHALLAGHEGILLRDPDAGERTAQSALQEAEFVDDVFAKATALENCWLFRSIKRDHEAALRFADEALRLLDDRWETGEASGLTHVYLSLLDNRVFSLQNLDRLRDADEALRTADEFVRKRRVPAGLPVSMAVNHYWNGRWDPAVTELAAVVDARTLDMAFRGLRESGPTLLLLHGVAALIAVLRDDDAALTEHMAAADDVPLLTSADRQNCDFLLAAEALAAEREENPEAALAALMPVLDIQYAPMMLRHQWLPDAVRIASQYGHDDLAHRALRLCWAEADRERQPARATAAANRCQGLVDGDPEPILAAAKHYRKVDRPVELAHALEDAAVLLKRTARKQQAQATLAEAVRRYQALGATWAARRAQHRMRRQAHDI